MWQARITRQRRVYPQSARRGARCRGRIRPGWLVLVPYICISSREEAMKCGTCCRTALCGSQKAEADSVIILWRRPPPRPDTLIMCVIRRFVSSTNHVLFVVLYHPLRTAARLAALHLSSHAASSLGTPAWVRAAAMLHAALGNGVSGGCPAPEVKTPGCQAVSNSLRCST